MSQSTYYDGTGVLIFEGKAIVTPVIKALFGAYNLDKHESDGENTVYFADIAEDVNFDWDCMTESLQELADESGVSIPEDEDEWTVRPWLIALAEKFGVADKQRFMDQMDKLDTMGDGPTLRFLFELALVFNDGHNLKAIRFEGAWHTMGEALDGFGGEGIYYGKHYMAEQSSQSAVRAAHELDLALESQDATAAAGIIISRLNKSLEGIKDQESRDAIRHKVVQYLNGEFALQAS